MWSTLAKYALKYGAYILGHQAAIDHLIQNAKQKNITAVVNDAAAIQADVKAGAK